MVNRSIVAVSSSVLGPGTEADVELRPCGSWWCGHLVFRRTGCGKAPAGFTDSRDLLILHLNQRAGSPAAALGNGLLVCGEVETDEEEEVRGDDNHSGDSSELLTSALAQVGHLREVGAREVGPRGEVDEA